jgi:tape measure domain-containing protein
MAGIKFDITGDNSNVLNAFRGVQDGVRRTQQVVESSGKSIEDVFDKIKSLANTAFVGFTAKEFITTLANVRGEFQQLEVAFNTMLGSKEKADALMGQLVELAATTPFDLKGVASGAKQLLAYGLEAEKVTDTMRRLGDIAAGLGLQIGDLAWLYGTTLTQGRMYTEDLNQFTGRGIPMIAELAKQFGVAESEVKQLVTDGKVGFPQVEQAIKNLTDEGGKFGGLMEAQSHTITGQISNIKDSINMAFNELGQQSEGIINASLSVVSFLVEHWRLVGDAIVTAAGAVGLYKAQMLAVSAINTATTNLGYDAEIAQLQKIVPLKQQTASTDLQEAVANGSLTQAKAEHIAAMREEAAAYVTELQQKAAAAQASYNEATAIAAQRALELEAAEDKVSVCQQAYDAALQLGDATKIATAEENLNIAAVERNTAAKQLQTARNNVATASKAAETAATEANTAAQTLNTSKTAADTAAKGVWASVVTLCKRVQDAWNASMLSSPLFWIAAAIAGATYAVYKLVTAETAHEKAIRKTNEAWDEFNGKLQERQSKIESLIRTIQDETATEFQQAEAYQQLSTLAPQLTDKYSQAALATVDFADAQKQVAASIDEAKYDEVKNKVEEYTQAVAKWKEQISSDLRYNGGKNAIFLSDQLEQSQAALDQWESKLTNIIYLRRQAEEDARPIEVRLKEAEDNQAVKQSIFDFYDRAITLAYEFQEGNENINYATGQSNLDEFIANAEKELDALRKKQEDNPMDLNLRLEEQEKTKILNSIIAMKNEWEANGSLVIPFTFQAYYKSAQTALNNAKKHFNYLTGQYENTATVADEVKTARENINKLTADIQGLRKGKILPKLGETVEKSINEKTKELQSAQRTLETLTGQKPQTGKQHQSSARKAENERKREEEKRKRAQEQLNNDLLFLEQKNIDDGIALQKEGTKKRLAEIDNDYKKRIAEIDKQEAEFKKKNKEAGLQGLGADGLTKEQQNALQKATDNAAKERERQTNEVYAAEAQAMRDYLKEYGTFQQQKLAIAEEYAEKIKNAQNEGERLSLTAERDRALQQVEINAIKQNIDWGSVFGDFGTMFRDQLQPTIDRLRQIANSDTFKQSSLEEQQVLYELIEKLENANAAWDSDIFKRVSDDMKAYQEAMHGYAAAVDKARIAEEKLADAKSTLDAAKRGGLSQEIINAAQSAVDEAQEAFNAASEEVMVFGAQVQETTTSLNSSATEAKAMFDGLAEGLRGLSSGSLQGIGEGVMSLDKLFGGNITQKAGNAIAKGFQSLLGKDSDAAKTLSEALGNSGLAGEIISAILGMLDMLAKGGIGGIVSNLYDTVLGSINGILDDIFSGGIITKPLRSVVDGVGGILDTITFGGFSSWTSSSNAKEVQATIDRLTDRNESLQSSIEALNDTMKDSNGAIKSVDAAEQAKEYQQEVNQNYLEMAKAQAGYHGSHHSWNYYWGGFSQEQIDKLSEQIGRDWNGNLWDLSPEEMKILKGNVDMWTQIQNTGKGGYGGRLAEKLDDYIDQAGKLEEIENTLNETLTQISFDSVYDSFIDTLMDMEASAEDFADDFSEYMMRAMLSDKIGTMFKDRIQEWYTDFAEAMKDGVLTDDELKQLRKEWDDIAADATAERDKLAEATGYDKTSSSASQQQASRGYSTTMSQETGDALYGRFTAMYEADLKIIAIFTDAVTTISTLSSVATNCNTELRNILNQQVITNSHLENIAKYTKNILDFGNKLDMIVTNTKNI